MGSPGRKHKHKSGTSSAGSASRKSSKKEVKDDEYAQDNARDGKSRDKHSRKRKAEDSDTVGNEDFKHDDSKQKSYTESKRTRPHQRLADIGDDDTVTESVGSHGGDISLSVAESNKLREKLGLPLLQLDDKPKVKEAEAADGSRTIENVYTKEGVEFVHKPPKNLSAIKKEEKLREKLDAMKEKRKVYEKFGSVKLLSAPEENDSAAAWVQKSRKLDEERKLAAQRAKILEEMDEDFGIGDLITDQSKGKKSQAYTSKDLKGLTVQHSLENIAEGSEMILVLQDKDVLDNDTEEILINPTLGLHEQWTKNAEIKKKKTGHDPFQDDFDEFGKFQEKKLLGKYDDEIDGEKKESFKIGSHGSVDVEFYKDSIAEKLRAQVLRDGCQNLDAVPAQLASEYYTKDEMAKFRKPKKKVKKIRKRGDTTTDSGELKADDLLNSVKTANEDFGSRQRGRGRVKQEYEEPLKSEASVASVPEHADLSRLNVEIDDLEHDESDAIDDDLTGLVIEDEAETELQSVLHRTRLLKQCDASDEIAAKPLSEEIADRVLRNVKDEPLDDEAADESSSRSADDPSSSAITLNAVSEYCRGLGDIPTYGLAGNRRDVDPTDMYYQQNSKVRPDYGDGDYDSDRGPYSDDEEDPAAAGAESAKPKAGGGRWIKAQFKADRAGGAQQEAKRESEDEEDDDDDVRPPILEDEPVTGSGVVAALKLAKTKGYLDPVESDDHGPSRLAHLESQRFTVIDKQFHDIDDKYAKKLERMGGHSGPVTDFKEKNNYQPKIKLEYADKRGNLMDAKEAFRFMSWKFHGKNPGKKKTEKRINKTSERNVIHQMSSTDTPLCTLSKQIDKQRQLNLPYIVLSGAGSKDMGTSIRKD